MRSLMVQSHTNYVKSRLTTGADERAKTTQNVLCLQLINITPSTLSVPKKMRAAIGLFSRKRTHRGSANVSNNTSTWEGVVVSSPKGKGKGCQFV